MIKTIDVNLFNLAPSSMFDDEKTQNILKAIDYIFQKRAKETFFIFSVLDQLFYMNDIEIENLLWEFNVDIIDTQISIERKRELILESLIIHMKKGTIGSLKKICSLLFNNFEVQEWYEYGGPPGKFKIFTDANIQDSKTYEFLIRTINKTKNVRSHLDEVLYKRNENHEIYIGTGNTIELKQNIEIGG